MFYCVLIVIELGIIPNYNLDTDSKKKLLCQTANGGSNPSLPAIFVWGGGLVFRTAVPKGKKKTVSSFASISQR